VSDPATLKDYCAGPTLHEKKVGMSKGDKVKADWNNYGTFYPGKVTKKRGNGTVDIAYDDGFSEKRVKAENIHEIKKKNEEEEEKAKTKPKDDPACQLLEFVAALKSKFGELNGKLSRWLLAQRAKVAKGEAPEAPPDMTAHEEPVELAAPPAAAPPDGVAPPSPAEAAAAPSAAASIKTNELEKLKRQLADRDDYLERLEKMAEENDKALRKLHDIPALAPAPAAKTVDDLIAEYKDKIAVRDQAIERLKRKISQQQIELARLGADQIDLQEIKDDVAQLVEEAEKVVIQRQALKEAGKLDDELRAIIDQILDSIARMERKVAHLLQLELEAEQRKAEIAARVGEDARRAEAQALEKARIEGKNAEEAERDAEKAVQAVHKEAEDEGKEADMKTLAAAQDVESELNDVEKHTSELDTGLHPHGKKWWRYRYEHSYIEAVIMIFIVILYLIWNVSVRQLKNTIYVWSLPPGRCDASRAEEIAEETHGAMYMLWLHSLAEQMLVCILVFLTVWTIAQTPLVHVIPQILRPSEDMRVPQDGEDYKRLALDICTIFFFAIMFFYGLMFAVAHESRMMILELKDFSDKQATVQASSAASRPRRLASMAESSIEFENCRQHFITHMSFEMQQRSSSEYMEISRLLGGSLEKFPLWHYLRLNVRLTVVELFTLSWTLWVPVVIVFVALTLLHRFAHMGYVRIMGFFAVLLIGIILSLFWRVTAARTAILQGVPPSKGAKSIDEKYNTEPLWMVALQFALFFVCYGVARTICQSWMWELHFWPVLCLTLVAIATAVVFVWLVAPAIPIFCAMMAMPPYMDPTNIKLMRHVAMEVSEGRHAMPMHRPSPRA